MNMNLNDLNMTPPAVEIPKKQKIKKKAKEQPVLTMKTYRRPMSSRQSWMNMLSVRKKPRR